MIVNATDVKNNFGKYIRLVANEDVIITKNGKTVGKLIAVHENDGKQEPDSVMRENAPAYNFDRQKVTYEQFLELATNTEDRYEYIDGKIYLMSSPKTIHQRILYEMSVVFYNWLKGKKCIPMFAPYDIKLKRNEKNRNFVQPDLMVICDLEEQLGDDDYYQGVPSLIVEIASKSTKSKDYVKKMDLYMDCGVSEYWIVDADSKLVHVYLFKDGDIFMNKTFTFADEIKSFYFEGLEVSLKGF